MKKFKSPTSSKTKLAFFGNERLATGVATDAPTLRALVEAGYQVTLVVANHDEGVSRNKRVLEIVDIAHAYHIPVMLPSKVGDIADRIVKSKAEAAILVAYGQIIPPKIIELFPKGIINIHPSLLPHLSGSTPVETAILNGLKTTGVSLMKLTDQMDAGSVYAQREISLSGSETKPELALQLLNEGVDLLISNLGGILAGSLKAKIQDETEATYTRQLTKQDGHVDFSEPAEVIERKVRAFLGFPKTRAKVFNKDIVITKARVANDLGDGELVIKCQPGYLEVLELTAPSGRSMSGSDFIRGYKKN
jgi:methionyl-tRNA formyltransferase